MKTNFPSDKKISILALGAESAGNFSVYSKEKIYFSEDFGDLLEEKNWSNYKKAVLDYLKKNKLKPEVILTDLHPLFKTTHWGHALAQKHKAKLIQIQHHHAHIFCAIGDNIIQDSKFQIKNNFYALAMDGTGYGLDGKIWGGEVFEVQVSKSKVKNIERIGSLENQTLIGGDLAIKEPARILISILSKFTDKISIYQYMEKYYSKNEFELLWNQLGQNFNCQKTSSTGRILDATSLLLGFCCNERRYKHEPALLLEANSTTPCPDIKPKIEFLRKHYELNTTFLFEYLVKNINQDKKRLAATAQTYIAQGLWEIVSESRASDSDSPVFFSGGLADNKIISSYLESKGAYASKTIPRGDAGISFGQMVFYLLNS
jgi:hydrogenase maturation protein HypF